ncbi:MAG: DinB family protein [Rubricoccaceae bacterium]|nr:DinB family protein [Rubricoccaceae bacterium]
MTIAESLLPEFDQEMAKTRTILELVPTDRNTWKPHPKSYTMEQLALHVANLPSWAGVTLTMDEFDMNPPGEDPPPPRKLTSSEKLLAEFDRNVAEAREVLASTSDETMFGDWTLLSAGTKMFTAPKAGVLRSFVLNHVIHHRAQLGVYLRLNDIPLPMIYGPTADTEVT